MKIVRFTHNGRNLEGILHADNHVTSLADGTRDKKFSMDEIKLAAPCRPSKIVCVGLNYKDHAVEMKMSTPDEPIIFIKPSTAVIGPNEKIIYPDVSSRVDYEAELAIVIKDKIKNISSDEAYKHIKGYTCFNDVTARDLQKKDGQWTRAKSFDTFACLGPWIETELDTKDLHIHAYLNGEMKQSSTTANFIFNVPYVVSFVSKIMTLLPDDVIATGTPAGIGPMHAGDEIVIEVEGIGRLRNYVVRA